MGSSSEQEEEGSVSAMLGGAAALDSSTEAESPSQEEEPSDAELSVKREDEEMMLVRAEGEEEGSLLARNLQQEEEAVAVAAGDNIYLLVLDHIEAAACKLLGSNETYDVKTAYSSSDLSDGHNTRPRRTLFPRPLSPLASSVAKILKRSTSTDKRRKHAVASSYTSGVSPGASKGKTHVVSSSGRCGKCNTNDTPQWRYIHTGRFCNACYMRVKRWVDSNHRGERKLPARARGELSPEEDQQLKQEAETLVTEAFRALEGR